LNELKAKHRSANIELLGEKTNKEVINYIKNSRAVVTATKLFEGQPTFLCEASLLGVPSIFPKSGGIEEFFPNNYDLSYNQFDYEDLISKFELLENLDTIKKIGIENKDYIKKHLNKNLLIKEFEKILYE
jgi:glycosyltransferase involved in cell wall biosynthesis